MNFMESELGQVYRETDYWILEGEGVNWLPLVLRVDEPCPEGLAARVGPAPWALLTAANPGSYPRDTQTNAELYQALRARLTREGYHHVAAVGFHPKSGWLEPMVLVWPISLESALEMAKVMGQKSILAAKAEESDCPAGMVGLFYTGV